MKNSFTVLIIIFAYDLFQQLHSPPYAACVMIELRKSTSNQFFISIYYKNTTKEPSPMNIPGCGTVCPLDKMYSLYNDVIPKDWESECKLSSVLKIHRDAEISVELGRFI